jgi:hypothetical protein
MRIAFLRLGTSAVADGTITTGLCQGSIAAHSHPDHAALPLGLERRNPAAHEGRST